MIKVKINDMIYEADVSGLMNDRDWDNRESKSIKLKMSHDEAISTFSNGASWFVLVDVNSFVVDEYGNQTDEMILKTEEYNNSDYCIAGDVVDHRDGTVTVKMGKLTELEEAYEILLGGI